MDVSQAIGHSQNWMVNHAVVLGSSDWWFQQFSNLLKRIRYYALGIIIPKKNKNPTAGKGYSFFPKLRAINMFLCVKAKSAAKPCLPATPSDDRLDIRKFATQPAGYSSSSTQRPPPFLVLGQNTIQSCMAR